MNHTRYLVLWGFDKVYSARWSGDFLSDVQPIIEHTVKNVIDVRVAEDVIAIVGKDLTTDASGKFALFLWQPGSVSPRKVLEREGLLRASLSPNKQSAAILVCDSNECALALTELTSGKNMVLAKSPASRSGEVSWHPTGSKLAFQSFGLIQVLDVKSSVAIPLIKGEIPSWSPDGKLIAYRSGKGLFLYDYERKSSVEIYRRFFWQSDFHGRLNWTPDGQYLSFNVFAGLTGYDNECIVIEVNSRKRTSIYSGPHFCGDWLSANPIAQRKQ